MQEKTCEPWLLHEFQDDFYGEELRLVVRLAICAALRTPARTRSINFESDLIFCIDTFRKHTIPSVCKLALHCCHDAIVCSLRAMEATPGTSCQQVE